MALDLFAQLLHQLRNPFQAGMDCECAAERVKCALLIAKLLQDDAEARERTEMARLARQHFVDIGKRAAKVLFRIEDRWVPGSSLGEVRPDFNGGVEHPDRKVEILCFGCSFCAAQQQIWR